MRKAVATKITPLSKKDEVYVQYVPLTHLEKWPRNPKQHDLPNIKASMVRWGFVTPIAIDERTSRMVAGHGRLEALLELKKEGAPPPRRIRVLGDEWLVPVLRGCDFKDEREAEAFLIADNKINERGGWDQDALSLIVRDLQVPSAGGSIFDFGQLGFSVKEVDKLLRGPLAGEVGEDDVPEKPRVPVTKPGNLWVLGDHRLLCGDATRADDVDRVMDGKKAVLMNTDPPYGDDWVQKARDMAKAGMGHSKAKTYESIASDDLDDGKLRVFLDAFLKTSASAGKAPFPTYLWCGSKRLLFERSLTEAGYHVHQQVYWIKPSFVIGRRHYQSKTECAIYGWLQTPGAPCQFYGERNQTDVWELARENEKVHPTQKPVELFRIPLRNHVKRGEIAYEPFSGSGSQIVAAQTLDRKCYAIELDPGYCDVAIERWQKLTGKKATRVKK